MPVDSSVPGTPLSSAYNTSFAKHQRRDKGDKPSARQQAQQARDRAIKATFERSTQRNGVVRLPRDLADQGIAGGDHRSVFSCGDRPVDELTQDG